MSPIQAIAGSLAIRNMGLHFHNNNTEKRCQNNDTFGLLPDLRFAGLNADAAELLPMLSKPLRRGLYYEALPPVRPPPYRLFNWTAVPALICLIKKRPGLAVLSSSSIIALMTPRLKLNSFCKCSVVRLRVCKIKADKMAGIDRAVSAVNTAIYDRFPDNNKLSFICTRKMGTLWL